MDPTQSSWVEVSRSPEQKTAQDHALVLEAMGIACGTARIGGWHVVIVRIEDAGRAAAEIAKFSGENRGWPYRAQAPEMVSSGIGAAAIYAGLLALVYVAQRYHALGFDWWSAGRADAALIRSGEWWRSLTALSLHADALHLAGNLAFGVLFGVMLAQSVGSGLAWIGFVVTGGLGNYLNAWLQPPSHSSIGASTAVFGMLGMQVAHDWIQRRQIRHGRVRRWAPLVLGVALLAWLGGGDRPTDPSQLYRRIDDLNAQVRTIDVWAHVCGFAFGVVLGSLYALRTRRASLPAGVQATLALAAPGAMLLAWSFALR